MAGNPTPRWEKWTPKKAAKVLEGQNGGNRRISNHRVNEYVQAMKAGNWRKTGETVQFDQDGNLINGQHRLRAIALSGVELELLTVRGVESSSFAFMDQGLPRRAQQFVHNAGGTQISAVRRARALTGTSTAKGGYGIDHTKNMEILLEDHAARWQTTFEKYLPIVNSIQKKKVPAAPLLATIAVAELYGSNAHRIEEFLSGLRSGVFNSTTDPRLKLRDAFAFGGVNAKDTDRALAYTVKAWNAFVSGTPCRRFRYNADEPFPTVL